MTLNKSIEELKAGMAGQMPPAVKRTMREATETLVRAGIAGRSLQAGDAAPDFELPAADGSVWRLSDSLRHGPVVLSFYRGGWCPYCNLEMQALQRALPEIERPGARLAAISPELPEVVKKADEAGSLSFPLLSDAGNGVARSFGLVFTLAEALRPIYAAGGIDLPAANGDDSFELPVPATYIIARNGRIAHAFVDADYEKRMEPDEIVDVLNKMEKGDRK